VTALGVAAALDDLAASTLAHKAMLAARFGRVITRHV
jgi:hypothetical protein